jgi:hypothetical protein
METVYLIDGDGRRWSLSVGEGGIYTLARPDGQAALMFSAFSAEDARWRAEERVYYGR